MLAVMFVSMITTLAGQPQQFWNHPESAMRFDGLSIFSHINHKFEFFIAYGWKWYVVSCLVYFVGAFALVSVLPARVALIAIFTLIFGHFYVETSWLATRWHSGYVGTTIYACAVAIGLTLSIADPPRHLLTMRRLSWIAAGALAVDCFNTLLGQPHSYWLNPATVYEGNLISRFFLLHGWWAYCAYDGAYCGLILLLAAVLPRRSAMICTFTFLLAGYEGASNWFFYVWRMGIGAVLLYAVVLSTVLVTLAFAPSLKLRDKS